MKSTALFNLLAAGFLITIIATAQPGSAQQFNFAPGSFTTTNVCANSNTPPPACQVLTNGSPNQPQATGGVLRLTTANANQHGSVWFNLTQPLSTGFTTSFEFQISNGGCTGCSFPADGLALVIQNDPAGTGAIGYTGNGQNMSYGNNDVSSASGPGAAILNSLAIELDTFANSDYADPDGNHIAVQSCGPNNSESLTPNSADHGYLCPNGKLAKLALQSLPTGLSLSDGKVHTITVNYTPPGSCQSDCNNLVVYLDSTLILQTTVDITQQLQLTGNGSAYVGFTAATGAFVEDNDIVSWSFSSLPLSPITIDQPLQPTVTNFNYTPTLSAVTDYSQSGLGGDTFKGLIMQGNVATILDTDFSALVNNTPFQGSTCQHQDTGSGTFGCVVTTDLCTTPTNQNPSGANCPTTGNPLIVVSNTYNIDPLQKPIIAPGYVMGKDTALSCGSGGDNICKGLVSIFTGINGDIVTSNGKTNNFNSILIPILGVVQPSTFETTTPTLNNGWTNGPVTVNLNSIETVPNSNLHPPSPLPTISSITYSVTGANIPNPSSATVPGSTASINIPGANEGSTVVTFFATDSSGSPETIVTNNGLNVSSASPTVTIQVDKTPPNLSCVPTTPTSGWQASDVMYACAASDSGSGLANPSQANYSISTNVPGNTENNAANIPATTVFDVAGNSASQGPFGPFQVDKKPPSITTPILSVANPVLNQAVTATFTCSDGGSGVVLCGPVGSSIIPAVPTITVVSNVDTSTLGPHTFTATSHDAVGNQSTPVSVNYTVVSGPQVTLSTTSINFGNVYLFGFGLQTVTVTNTGSATVNISGVTLTLGQGADGDDFTLFNLCGSTLAVGKSCTISVLFFADDSGTPTATINLADNVVGSPQHVSLSGTVINPQASFKPSSLNFGSVQVGHTSTQNVVLTSSGSTTLNITNIAVTGSNAGDFTTSSCPSSLAPGATCTIAVTFKPTIKGSRSANLTVTDNMWNSKQSVPLSGKGN